MALIPKFAVGDEVVVLTSPDVPPDQQNLIGVIKGFKVSEDWVAAANSPEGSEATEPVMSLVCQVRMGFTLNEIDQVHLMAKPEGYEIPPPGHSTGPETGSYFGRLAADAAKGKSNARKSGFRPY